MIKTVAVPELISDYNNKNVDILNGDFKVSVNGNVVPCYKSRCSKIPFNRVYDGVQRPLDQTEIRGYVSFEADEEVEIEVQSVKSFKSAVVRPLSKKVQVTVDGGKIKFRLKKVGQYSVEFDDAHNSLSLFFNPVSDFNKQDFYTYYFGAGVHLVGMLNLKSGDKVYIDKDAVVYGGIYAKDAEDILIEGYGIIDGACLNRLARGLFNRGNILMENCKNIKINGTILQDACIWAVSFFNCENIEIDNVKLTGQWRYNTDGIDFVNSRNVHLANSFVHSFDDSIVIKGQSQFSKVTIEEVENITVENCVLWCDWGRTIEIGIETIANEIRNITFKNCDLIHNSASAIDIQNGDCALVRGVTIKDVNVEFQKATLPEIYQESFDMVYDGYGKTQASYLIWIDNHKYNLGKGMEIFDKRVKEYVADKRLFGAVENVLISGVNVSLEDGMPKLKMKIFSLDQENPFKDITIKDVYLNGKKAAAEDFELTLDARTENVKLF